MIAKYRSDSDIHKDILDELKWAPEIDETDIGVIVNNGSVILSGTVPTYMAKTEAKSAAKRIKGVRAVADEIQVKLPSQLAGTDGDLAQRIATLFTWNSQIPGDDVKAEVRDGIVTLTGDVDWQYQKEYIEHQVEGIDGIRLLINTINIRKRAAKADVQRQIVKALHRQATVEADQLSVEVANGTVTLTGKVESLKEIELIKRAAWSAPGVTEVVSNLHFT